MLGPVGGLPGAAPFPPKPPPPPVASSMAVANALTFDLEDWFQVSNVEHLIPFAQWETCDSRLERNTRRLLELLARAQVSATFFVLGWNAERFPHLVQEIAEAGHEIASHGYAHRLVYEQTPEAFAADLARANEAIVKACGITPAPIARRPFRSPPRPPGPSRCSPRPGLPRMPASFPSSTSATASPGLPGSRIASPCPSGGPAGRSSALHAPARRSQLPVCRRRLFPPAPLCRREKFFSPSPGFRGPFGILFASLGI